VTSTRRGRDGRLARAIVALGALGAAWLAFDARLGSKRVSRARSANLRARDRSIHRANPIRAGETVFLGDSITSDGDWEAAFSHLDSRNRGIAWDTTADVLERLDESLDGPPATVVLMIGTNDLFIGVPHAQTVRNVAHVLDRIAEASPDTRTIVQSVLPGPTATTRWSPHSTTPCPGSVVNAGWSSSTTPNASPDPTGCSTRRSTTTGSTPTARATGSSWTRCAPCWIEPDRNRSQATDDPRRPPMR